MVAQEGGRLMRREIQRIGPRTPRLAGRRLLFRQLLSPGLNGPRRRPNNGRKPIGLVRNPSPVPATHLNPIAIPAARRRRDLE